MVTMAGGNFAGSVFLFLRLPLFPHHFPDGVMHPFDSVAEYFVFCVKAHDLNVHFCNDLTAVETLMWCGDPFYVRRIAL